MDLCEEKGLKIKAEIKDDVRITSDPELLDIVWNNLIGNAVKFTPKGGEISVSLEELDESIVVCVTDTGIGISKDAQRHIFERFYQCDTSHQTEGNGLGLSLVKKVVEILEGDISVESQEGRGTIFEIRLKKED